MIYHWEFERGRQQLSIAVKGPLVLNDRELAMHAALQGIGIALWAEHRLQPYIASGRLVPLLEDWSPAFPGFFAYFRKQRFMPPALRALIDALKMSASAGLPRPRQARQRARK